MSLDKAVHVPTGECPINFYLAMHTIRSLVSGLISKTAFSNKVLSKDFSKRCASQSNNQKVSMDHKLFLMRCSTFLDY